jgi:hypothetical protein
MKRLEPKKPRALNPEPAVKKRPSKPTKTGLSKKDPDYYSKIGAISAAKRKMKPEQFSEMARRSHPRPGGYFGGRPKKDASKDA